MEEFALIMRHEDGGKVISPEQLQQWMKQTMDWIGGIAAQNKFVSGTGLPFEDARMVKSDKVVTNGPFGDIKALGLAKNQTDKQTILKSLRKPG